MKTKDIPLKDLERYEFVARKYVENSRKWKLEEYRIKFLWFDDELNMAVFSAANLESLEKTAKAFRERGGETLMRDPSEFTVMVDTVGMKAYEDRKDIPTPWDPTIWPEKYQEH